MAQNVLKHIFTSFAATLMVQMFTMVGGVMTARVLGPSGKGELTAIILWPSFIASIGSIGLIDALAFFGAKSHYGTSKILASGMVIAVGLSSVLIGVGYFILPLVWTTQDPDLLEVAMLYLIFIPLNLVALSLMSVLWGKMRLTEYNFLRAFVHVIFVIGIVFLYAIDQFSVRHLVEVSLGANLATLIIAFGIVLKNQWVGWIPDGGIIKDLLGYGLKVHLGSIASMANARLDQVLLTIFLPKIYLGLYVVAVTLSSAVSLAANTLTVVAFPKIANLGSIQEKKQALGRFSRLTLLLCSLAAAALLCITPWVLRIFFTTSYLPATDAARILIVASVPLGLNAIFVAGFKAFNRPLIASQAELIGFCFTGLGLWILLPRYGIIGAAWASLLSYCAVAAFMLYSLKRSIDMKAFELFRSTSEDWQYCVYQISTLRSYLKGFLGI